LNNGANITISCILNTTVNSSTIGTVEGFNTIQLWANDTLGFISTVQNNFTISTTAPAISLNNPINNKIRLYSSLIKKNTLTKNARVK
jgi:hypothetical protein